MYRRDDPRLQRTLNTLSHNVESATEHAQENLYTFTYNYVNPCLSSISETWRSCTASCCPGNDDWRRRQRARSRGRAELNFDFYDDWDEDENDALLGWSHGSDQLDRLLSTNTSPNQPSRERAMNYGTRGPDLRPRRKSAAHIDAQDPNVITGSNYLGFLGRLPWGMGRKVLRYKPSAADLQEHPGVYRPPPPENQPLIEESDEEEGIESPSNKRKHKRNRSDTGTSGHTTDSLSSRGDLFPSEDELDDAMPLDDDFMILERRDTGEGSGGKRPRYNRSRPSLRTVSSTSTKSLLHRKASGSDSKAMTAKSKDQASEPPTFSELKAEEDQIIEEEEGQVARKREVAKRLAVERGLSSTRSSSPGMPEMTDLGSKSPSSNNTVPFPTFDPPTGPQTPHSELENRLETVQDVDTEGELPSQRTDHERDQGSSGESFTPAALPRFT